MEGKQGYLKGMDQDTAFTKRDSNSYFRADNFRVVTDEGSSSGSLETEKGTVIAFKVPDLAEMTLTDGTVIPAQSDLKIIGSCTMVDELILFTTNSTSVNPSSYGQIWKCKYNEGTGVIEGLTGLNELDPALHLFYNQALNFSTEYRIGRAVALYETATKQRVYWTDNYNQVRTFNLAVDNPLDVSLTTLDLFPGASLPQPVMIGLESGNLPSKSQIQFTYRLINTGGGESSYAPPTPLIPLPTNTVVANSFNTWQGGGSGNNKAVRYTINGLDTSYNVIEHVAIIYDNTGSGFIWKFAEDSVPANGSLEVLCTSLTDATSISLEEYSVIETGFDRCKDIEVHGNRLIAANLRTDKSEFEFDARAYRFNDPYTTYAPFTSAFPTPPVAPLALLKDTNNSADDIVLVGGGSVPVWDSVPETHDCQNIFNREQEANWFDPAQQYKYQSDGTTVGGEGKNIKYEFTTIDMVGNNDFGTVTDAPNHISVPSHGLGTAPLYKGEIMDGSPQPVHIENQIANMAGHWAHMNYTGYARGEVYRFGIVFYDKKGVPSFVEWIGDIKFPDVSDGYPLQRFENGQAILQQLGIKFSVDVSSIAGKVSGYSIVRLPREDVDKTKVGTGFFMHFNTQDDNAENSLMHRYFITGLGLGSGSGNNDPFPVTNGYQAYGDDNYLSLHLSDRPGTTNLTRLNDVYARLGFLISPLGSEYTTPHTETDYIETLEYYSAELHKYYEPASGTGSLGTDSDFGFYYKMKNQILPPHNLERIQVEKAKDLYEGERILKSNSFMQGLDTSTLGNNQLDLLNTSYTRDKALLVSGDKELVPLGIGSSKKALRLHTPASLAGATDIPPTIPHMSYQVPTWFNLSDFGSWTHWYGPDFPSSSITLNFGGGAICNQELTFKSVGYRRYLELQYGGPSFEARSTDQYLYIGHHQLTLNAPTTYNLETEIYGGDTYVNYYDNEYIERYVADVQNPVELFKPWGTNKLSVAACGPVESAVNTNWRSGRIWAKDRQSSDMGDYALNSRVVEPIWNQEDDVQNKFFAEDFLAQFVEEHPAMLWASKVKINGELVDSWRNFPIANKKDVDGIHGPINRILSFKDNLLFYQDKAFGIAALDERSIIQDQTGQSLVLGEGGVFPDYRYVSTNTGTVHQFSVIDTENAVYHYDARLKKFMKFDGGIQPLSDLAGLSSFFAEEVTGLVTDIDKTLRPTGALGVHGTYDQRYNRVLYTFQTNQNVATASEYVDEEGNTVIPAGSYVQVGTVTYYAQEDIFIAATRPPTSPNLADLDKLVLKYPDFTIGYNEMLGAFESFYDYHPGMYLEYGRRLFSVSPFQNNELHQHNVGLPGQYYDVIKSKSKLHTVFSQPGDINKVWNNIGYMAELYDTNDNDVYDETIDRMQFRNNYQDTGVIELTPNDNIKRRMRTWRAHIPREQDKALSRMRNPWLECLVEYDNLYGYRHVLHDLIYSFTPARM